MRDGRRGINWRHVLVAGVVGVLAGAVIPGGIQVAERAAVSGDQSNLRDVAMEYLTAIAEGRASDATAMLPVQPAAMVPDAVLQSARRITDAGVRLVHIDGDAAAVEVEYTLDGASISRTLEAERVDGSWQLTRPLTEAVPFHQYSGTAGARIANFEISLDRPMVMYPGIYRFDPVLDDPIIIARSDAFSVDGDPATASEPFIETTLRPEVAAHAEALAVAAGERCRQADTCYLPQEGALRVDHDAWVVASSPQAVDVIVHLTNSTSTMGQTHQVMVQIERDAAGGAAAWRCSEPDAYGLEDAEPCPAIE
ncbi:hypothetical protein [Agrococcus sp. ProA11]|uniref:hypothetical protein n=1 Tax=Agrococcus chionoecetis TaxID=3153752 RepID=UPI003261908D